MSKTASIRVFWTLLACLFAASAFKHLLAFSVGPPAIIFDASEYWNRAQTVLHGDWLQLSEKVDYRMPLYPWFLAVMQGAFGQHALMATAITQHLLQMACGLMTAWICFRVSGSHLVCLTGYAVSVLCLTRCWWANVSLTGTLFMFFLTATLAALVAYDRRPTAARFASMAALLGAATLVRPIPQMLWLPLFSLAIALPRPNVSRRTALLHVLAGVAAFFVVLSPAMIRNALSVGHGYAARVPPINKWVVCFHDRSAANLPIPPTPAGQKLLALVPELESGRSEDRSGYAVLARLQQRGLDARQIDDLVSQVCLDAILRDPGIFAWQTFKRLGNFWRCTVGPYPYYSHYALDDPDHYLGQRTWRIEPLASWAEFLLEHTLAQSVRWLEVDFVACMLGTFLLIRRPETRFIGLALAIMFVYFPTITALLEVESFRYRRVLEPAIVVAIVTGLFGTRDCFPPRSPSPTDTAI